MRRALPIGLLALIALGSIGYYVFRDRGVPSAQTIKDIEAQIVLPEGAHPLTSYMRYYAYGWNGWRPVVVGSYQWFPKDVTVYFKSGLAESAVPGVPGAYALEHSPTFYAGEIDDACQIVFLHYDDAAKKFIPVVIDGKEQPAWCAGKGSRLAP